MKKIVPFNNVLEFNTDVSEITAISLEHDIKKNDDSILGEFKIYGEYKINDGDINKERFEFILPFEIALGCRYKEDTLVIDIDDFRYDLIDRNKIKVNIDLYIDGEEIREEIREEIVLEEKELDKDSEVDDFFTKKERDSLMDKIDNEEIDNINININNNENIGVLNEEKCDFVTYRVYRVVEGDTINNIMEKYKITKEEIESYNNIDNIKIGDKLIIPYNDK